MIQYEYFILSRTFMLNMLKNSDNTTLKKTSSAATPCIPTLQKHLLSNVYLILCLHVYLPASMQRQRSVELWRMQFRGFFPCTFIDFFSSGNLQNHRTFVYTKKRHIFQTCHSSGSRKIYFSPSAGFARASKWYRPSRMSNYVSHLIYFAVFWLNNFADEACLTCMSD